MKTSSPTLGFQHPGANIPQIPTPRPPLQRTAIQRHQARRSGQFLPKLAPGHPSSDAGFQSSPKGHPTPSSYASSPTSIPTRSPMIMQQDTFTPPNSAVVPPPQQYANFSRSQANQPFYHSHSMSPTAQRPPAPARHQSSTSIASNSSTANRPKLTASGSAGVRSANAEPSPSHIYTNPFQKHIEQLGKSTNMELAAFLFDPR